MFALSSSGHTFVPSKVFVFNGVTPAAAHNVGNRSPTQRNCWQFVTPDGNTPGQLYAAVQNGFQDKGMPPWGPTLGEKRTREVIAFVLSIKNTNVPGGKAPQGEPQE